MSGVSATMVGGDARRSLTEVVIATKSFSRACDHAQASGSAIFSSRGCRPVHSLPIGTLHGNYIARRVGRMAPRFTDPRLWRCGFRSWPPICPRWKKRAVASEVVLREAQCQIHDQCRQRRNSSVNLQLNRRSRSGQVRPSLERAGRPAIQSTRGRELS
jgi:hypothetical protein